MQLMDAGHEVQVISFEQQYPAWLYPGESDKDHSPSRLKVPAEYTLTPLNPLSWQKTLRTIRDFRPDHVILPWWVTFWGPAFSHIIARLKRWEIQITMLIHNTMPHEARFFDRFLARRALKGADRYIVMTTKEKIRLQKLLPKAEQIWVVPHPIYRMFKPSPKTQTQIRSQLGLPHDEKVSLFFGFIRPYKGLEALLEALKILQNQGEIMHLMIAGEFWDDRGKYIRQIEDLGLTGFVHIFDHYIPDDDAAQYFTAADLFVAPYTGGTQSGALKAALGSGLPTVVTETIADELILSMKDRCKVVPSKDPEALAAAILEQASLPILGEDQVQELFKGSWELLVGTLSSSYEIYEKMPDSHDR